MELDRVVARLALPAEDQLAYLARIGVGDLADELALDFDAEWDRSAAYGLHPQDMAILSALNALLTEMSPGAEQLWRAEGLRTDPRWAEIRRLAKEFLFSQHGRDPSDGG